MTTTLRKKRLDEATRRFHDTIDDLEIERQLDGQPVTVSYIPRTMEFESPEQALVAKFISLPLNASGDGEALGGKAVFIEALVNLCLGHECRWHSKEDEHRLTFTDPGRWSLLGFTSTVQPTRQRVHHENAQWEPTAARGHKRPLSSMVNELPHAFQDHLCLICGKSFKRKFTRNRHLETHVKAGRFARPFQCRVLGCAKLIEGEAHYKNHCATVHHIWH